MEFYCYELLKVAEPSELETLKIHLHYYEVFDRRSNYRMQSSTDIDAFFEYLSTLFGNIRIRYFEETCTTCILIKDPIISRYFAAREKVKDVDMKKYKNIVREFEDIDDEYVEGAGWCFRKKGKKSNDMDHLFIAFSDDGYVVEYVGLTKILIDMRYHMEKIIKELEGSV